LKGERCKGKSCIEALYEGKMADHLGHEKNQGKPNDLNNVCNGYSSEVVKSKHGEIQLEVPRDREGGFDPQIAKA